MLRLTSLAVLAAAPAAAAEKGLIAAADVPIGATEEALAAAIGLMIIFALASVLLVGRVSVRTHAALAILVVLVGGFALLVLFGQYVYRVPLAAVGAVIVLTGLFRLLNRFEAPPRSGAKPHADAPGREPHHD